MPRSRRNFYNRLTDTLQQKCPDLKFATIAYQGYRDVPQCRIRNSEFIAPGDWSTKPHNLLGALKTAITPAYGFVP